MIKLGSLCAPHVVTCDYDYKNAGHAVYSGEAPGCTEIFQTYADKSVVVKQLEFAGWQRLTPLKDDKTVCPMHARVLRERMGGNKAKTGWIPT